MDNYLDSWNVDDATAERNFREARSRLSVFGERACFMRCESGEAAAAVEDLSLDFVYIDANHSFEAALRDIVLWYTKVRSGGIVSGHDYFDAIADGDLEPDFSTSCLELSPRDLTSYGVKSAVNKFVAEHNYEVSITDEKFPTWYFLKK